MSERDIKRWQDTITPRDKAPQPWTIGSGGSWDMMEVQPIPDAMLAELAQRYQYAGTPWNCRSMPLSEADREYMYMLYYGMQGLVARLRLAEKRITELESMRASKGPAYDAPSLLPEPEIKALRAKIEQMEKQEPVAWTTKLALRHGASALGFDACAGNLWGEKGVPLYALPGAQAQPAKNAVAYLDLGTGGYMDVGTDLTDEELATLPKGRHMLGIIGTYGVDGYVPAQPAPSVPMDVIVDYLVSISAHLARRDDAKAQAEIGELLKMIASAPKPGASVPEDVMRDAERYRYLRARDDGTAGVGCWIEADGRVCDRGWLYGVQLDSAIDSFIEVLAAAPKPEAKP